MRALILGAVLSVSLPSALLSQRLVDLQQGTRVMITDQRGKEVKGRLIKISADSVFVRQTAEEARTVPMSNVKSVKVGHVSHLSGLVLGAVYGGLIGVVGGGLLGAMDDTCDLLACGRGENMAFGAGAFGTVGLVLGSMFGLMGGKEVWQSLPMPLHESSSNSR
ncbi:MAG TPA: hypothetical protein VM099_09700 [Gemmatimonadaceae bacterium]|nr:hypothetical protein [Gemmatimonadaceae bacterium]